MRITSCTGVVVAVLLLCPSSTGLKVVPEVEIATEGTLDQATSTAEASSNVNYNALFLHRNPEELLAWLYPVNHIMKDLFGIVMVPSSTAKIPTSPLYGESLDGCVFRPTPCSQLRPKFRASCMKDTMDAQKLFTPSGSPPLGLPLPYWLVNLRNRLGLTRVGSASE